MCLTGRISRSTMMLKPSGWRVVGLLECQTKEDVASCVSAVRQALSLDTFIEESGHGSSKPE